MSGTNVKKAEEKELSGWNILSLPDATRQGLSLELRINRAQGRGLLAVYSGYEQVLMTEGPIASVRVSQIMLSSVLFVGESSMGITEEAFTTLQSWLARVIPPPAESLSVEDVCRLLAPLYALGNPQEWPAADSYAVAHIVPPGYDASNLTLKQIAAARLRGSRT